MSFVADATTYPDARSNVYYVRYFTCCANVWRDRGWYEMEKRVGVRLSTMEIVLLTLLLGLLGLGLLQARQQAQLERQLVAEAAEAER